MSLIAAALLVRTWQLGRRQTTFDIIAGVLNVTQEDPLAKRRWCWRRDELIGIGRRWEGSRGVQTAARLEIRPQTGRPTLLPRRHDPIEAEWLGKVLLRTL